MKEVFSPKSNDKHSVHILAGLIVVSILLVGLVALTVQSRLQNVEETAGLWLSTPRLTKCKNTASGRQYVTDQEGHLCFWEQLDPITHCCNVFSGDTSNKIVTDIDTTNSEAVLPLPTFNRYACDACDPASNCCSIYEFCVSCCMNPTNYELLTLKNQEEALKYFNIYTMDSFDVCSAICRTSSRSIITDIENKFISEYKYCFGSSPPPSEQALEGRSDIQEAKQRLSDGDRKLRECYLRGNCEYRVLTERPKELSDSENPHLDRASRSSNSASQFSTISWTLTALISLVWCLLAHAFVQSCMQL